MLAVGCLVTSGPPESPWRDTDPSHQTASRAFRPRPHHPAHLARVLPSLSHAGTHHVVGQVLVGTSALVVSHHRHHHFLEDVRQLTCSQTHSEVRHQRPGPPALTISRLPPPGDPAAGAAVEGAARRGQAHWGDVVSEGHRSLQLEQAEVVVQGQEVVLGVARGPLDPPRFLPRVRCRLAVAAQNDGDVPVVTGPGQRQRRSALPGPGGWVRPPTEAALPHAVGGGEHPAVGDQGASATEPPKLVQTDLPRPVPWRRGLASHHPGVAYGNAAFWKTREPTGSAGNRNNRSHQ